MSVETPSTLPRRQPRAAEAAEWLRAQLHQGAWNGELPGELELARELQVGRNTLRAALKTLEHEGLLRTAAGKRRLIVRAGGEIHPAHAPAPKALLLLSHPQSQMPLPWAESLRLQLHTAGRGLAACVEPAAFRRSPGAALERLHARNPRVVWILHRSTAAMQRWFQQQGLPAVIAGTQHPEITLPQVDTDYRAASRHAAGRFLALGHRRLAILLPRELLAGDAESVAGFMEAAGEACVERATHDETAPGVVHALRQALAGPAPPSGIFVLRAEPCATALSWLLAQGIAVPGRLSLLCRDDHPFLGHLHPEPSRYRSGAEMFARKLARLVLAQGDHLPLTRPRHLIMPAFVKGSTLGPAPVPKKNK